MSDELERLKADLEVLQRHQGYSIMENAIADLADKIARLEAEADPWREAKVAVERFLKSPNHRSEVVVGEYIDHLIAKVEAQKKQIDYLHAEYENRGLHISELVAENDRLEKRVAELEAALKRIATVPDCGCVPCRGQCDSAENLRVNAEEIREIARVALQGVKPIADMQPPFEGPIVGIEPVLDPARVLATAAIIYGRKGLPLSEGMCRKDSKGANPYRLKGASDE